MSNTIKEIVIIDQPGQLCNQIWSYSPFIAYSRYHKMAISIYGFWEYEYLFPGLASSEVKFIPKRKLYDLASRIIIKIMIIRCSDILTAPKILGGKTYVRSWYAEKPTEEFYCMQNYLRKIFKLPVYSSKKTTKYRIGIHVRRGDYISWRGGRYYYSINQYYEEAVKLAIELFPGEKVEFAIASNEPMQELADRLPNAIYERRNSAVDDLALLSSCSVIIGPPSTFSMWASFYSSVPMLFLLGQRDAKCLSMPPYIIRQNKFSDGSSLDLG